MKRFNAPHYFNFLKEIESIEEITEKSKFFKEVPTYLRKQSYEYNRCGVLNKQDLLQEAYIAFDIAWNKIKWGDINTIEDPEYRLNTIRKYLRQSILLEVKEAGRASANGISGTYSRGTAYKVDNTALWGKFVKLFPTFFGTKFAEKPMPYDITPWQSEQLAIGLEELMDLALSFKEKDILYRFYGIDQAKQSMSSIAGDYKISNNAVTQIKKRAIKKLREFPNGMLIIKKYYQF